MPSDQQNLTIWAWFFTLRHCFSPRGAFRSTHRTFLMDLTSVLLHVPFIFADSKKCWFGGGTWWLPFTKEIVRIYHSIYFDYEGAFWTAVYTAVQWVEHGWKQRISYWGTWRQHVSVIIQSQGVPLRSM